MHDKMRKKLHQIARAGINLRPALIALTNQWAQSTKYLRQEREI